MSHAYSLAAQDSRLLQTRNLLARRLREEYGVVVSQPLTPRLAMLVEKLERRFPPAK
jgi:hypothetical protein